MKWQSLRICKTLRRSVPGANEMTNIGYLVMTVRVVLSVLVSWVIRVICMFCATSSVRTSSSGTLGGMPLNTSRGSGNGYVWYANLADCISTSRML